MRRKLHGLWSSPGAAVNLRDARATVFEKLMRTIGLLSRVVPYRFVKRLLDVIIAPLVLIAVAPLLLFVIVLIRIDSRGPVFFIQDRVGRDGATIRVIKLRTMTANAALGSTRTEANDSRITRVGRLIRRSTVDELPQLLNVIRGDMSLIGPRPISVAEQRLMLETLAQANRPVPQGLVPRVAPAMLGWAILHGRERISWEERFRLNAEYENNLSLGFDAKIFFLTVALVLAAPFRAFARFTRRST